MSYNPSKIYLTNNLEIEMNKIIGKIIKEALLSAVLCLMITQMSFAEQAETIEDAFKNGTFNGTIGSYYEFKDREGEKANAGWATAYFTLKYETQDWERLSFGGRFFVHGQLYSDAQNGTSDPFNTDIEKEITLPEIYLNYNFFEESNVRIGRWNHKKISHIDDAQSEGVYVQFKEIENLGINAGFMRRFAEIDYDDGEDFGRKNDSQDLDSETTYGPGSSSYLMFLEGKYTPFEEWLIINPYIMYQKNYAAVYGFDTKIEGKQEDYNFSYGAKASYYYVAADIVGSGDSNSYKIEPFMNIDPVSFSIGYARFDDGDALNKPAWLADYFLPLDQLITYGMADSNIVFSKIKLTLGKFWTHFAFSNSQYAFNAKNGDGAQEYELQFGYKFLKSLDWNIRLFDVKYQNVDYKDYQKVESRVRFKF